MIARMMDDDIATNPRPKVAKPTRLRPREDWRRWLPAGVAEPKTITRAELLAEVKDLGLAVTERELRYWESLGTLPYPVRQFRDGATHALYPWWHAEIVATVPTLRGQGLDWAAIGARTRDLFAARANRTGPVGRWSGADQPPLPAELVVAIQKYIVELNGVRDTKITVAHLRLIASDGDGTDYVLFGPDAMSQ